MEKIQISKPIVKYRKAEYKDFNFLAEQRIIYLCEIENDESQDIAPLLKQTTLQYFIDKTKEKNLVIIIAEIEDIAIGWGCLVIREEPPYFGLPDGKKGYIFFMYTNPDYRNIGIGSKILEQLITEGKSMGLKRFELNTTELGRNLYLKFGFKDSQFPLMELCMF